MILSAHQPNFLPYLGYFDKIAKADLFVLFDDVQYDPNDFINRNKIKTKDGWQWLTVPVLHKGYQQTGLKIKDVQIDNSQNWRKKHLKSIELAYKKAPYFDKYYPQIKNIYSEIIIKWNGLSYHNTYIIKCLCMMLGITTKIVKASDYNFKGKKSDLVLDMNVQLGASKYIFGSQGKDYVDIEAFTKAGIEVEFQDYQHPTYNQLYEEFVSHMSVLDLLFNEGDKSLGILRN